LLVPLVCLTVETQSHGAREGGRIYGRSARRRGAMRGVRQAHRTRRGPHRGQLALPWAA